MQTPEEKLLAVCKEHGITMTCVFVPWSQSRNKDEKRRTLNWRVTLHRDGYDVVTTDYTAGTGYCPSYKQGRMTVDQQSLVDWECENGFRGYLYSGTRHIGKANSIRLEPKLADVVHSLVLDTDVLDHPSFESWAQDFGYDPDSRKAEAVYRACLDTALKVRTGLSDALINKLREAGSDY